MKEPHMPPEDQTKHLEFLQKFERLVLTSENNAENLSELKTAFQDFKRMFYQRTESQGKDFQRLDDDVRHLCKEFNTHLAEHKNQLSRDLSVWMMRISGAAAIISLLGVIGLYLK